MRSLKTRLYLLMVFLGILFALSACGSSTSNSSGNDAQNNSNGSAEYSEEIPSDAPSDMPEDMPSDMPTDMPCEEEVDDFSWRQELLEMRYYYNAGEMTPERQGYRLSCFSQGVNLSALGGNGLVNTYTDAMRNVYDLIGADCVFTGQIDYVERTGFSTYMILKRDLVGLGNSYVYITASVEDDLPVTQGDTITIFGTFNGPSTYTMTNQYGTVTEHNTFDISILDYYFGEADPVSVLHVRFSMGDEKSWARFQGDHLIPGAPTLTEEEAAYWYGTYESGVTLTENAVISPEDPISSLAEIAKPYTVYSYAYDPEFGAYVLYFRYDDLAEHYPDSAYSILILTYERIDFFTDGNTQEELKKSMGPNVAATYILDTNSSRLGMWYALDAT